MPQQPELTSTSVAPNPAPAPGPAPAFAPVSAPEIDPAQEEIPSRAPQRIPPWLVRAELFLRVFLLTFISLVIVIAPWSGDIVRWLGDLLWFLPTWRYLWDQNALIQYFPVIAHYSSNGAVRGVVSGLGLLNLWIALHGAFHHWDE